MLFLLLTISLCYAIYSFIKDQFLGVFLSRGIMRSSNIDNQSKASPFNKFKYLLSKYCPSFSGLVNT